MQLYDSMENNLFNGPSDQEEEAVAGGLTINHFSPV